MAFSLMPDFDRINLVADLDPAATARDQELGRRIQVHPKIAPMGVEFGYARQTGTEWRIEGADSLDPVGARYDLGHRLRREALSTDRDPETTAAMRAAAERLDPDEGEQIVKDEWEIGDHRYRLIRIEKTSLIGSGTLEPPRAGDTDPAAGVRPLKGFLLDPVAPAGHWETQLRLNLSVLPSIAEPVPEQVRLEAGHGIRTHPGVVLLPPTFTVMEIKGTAWEPCAGGDGPEAARSDLADHFARRLPRLREFTEEPVSPAELAEWTEMAEQIMATPGHEFNVSGRLFRTVRISQMIRLGRDGPEAPRPSDQACYGYPPST